MLCACHQAVRMGTILLRALCIYYPWECSSGRTGIPSDICRQERSFCSAGAIPGYGPCVKAWTVHVHRPSVYPEIEMVRPADKAQPSKSLQIVIQPGIKQQLASLVTPKGPRRTELAVFLSFPPRHISFFSRRDANHRSNSSSCLIPVSPHQGRAGGGAWRFGGFSRMLAGAHGYLTVRFVTQCKDSDSQRRDLIERLCANARIDWVRSGRGFNPVGFQESHQSFWGQCVLGVLPRGVGRRSGALGVLGTEMVTDAR